MIDSDLLTHIMKAFLLVDKDSFRRLLTYLRPSLSDNEIPHRQTLRNRIIDKGNLSEVWLKKVLEVRPITYCKQWIIHLYARMSLVRSRSPSMPGHHRLATRTCPSRGIISMVQVLRGSCTQNSLLSVRCQATILEQYWQCDYADGWPLWSARKGTLISVFINELCTDCAGWDWLVYER